MTKIIIDFEEIVLKPFLDKKNIKFEKQDDSFHLAFASRDSFGDFVVYFGYYINNYNQYYNEFIDLYNKNSEDKLSIKDKRELYYIIDFLSQNIDILSIKNYNPFIS